MKVARWDIVALVVVSALVLGSCASVANNALQGALGGLKGGVGASAGTAAAAAPEAAAEFQSGEVLCSADARPMMDSGYYVAKVLTQASSATKNQAEVVFIADGKKFWVNYVVNSRKATKADFTVGATIFFLAGWQDHDEISPDVYRKVCWRLGNITSTEELFKNRVEIGGDSFATAFLRVPTDPIK
jgi:hypothetical protein